MKLSREIECLRKLFVSNVNVFVSSLAKGKNEGDEDTARMVYV